MHYSIKAESYHILCASFVRPTSFDRRQLQRAKLFTHVPERNKIMAMDVNGDGVDEIEFIVGMLSILGVTVCGEPLGYNDVHPFRILFKRLNVSNTGKLSRADLEAYATLAEQAAAKRSQNINAQPAANNSSRISDPYLANAA